MIFFPPPVLRIDEDVPDGSGGLRVPIASWRTHRNTPLILPLFLQVDVVRSRVATFLA
jgi:hypothetical protein